MANYQAPDTEFQAVANAIRTKGGTSGQLTWPNGFISAINAIPSGGGGGSLPSEYQEVEWLLFSGAQFVSFGLVGRTGMTIESAVLRTAGIGEQGAIASEAGGGNAVDVYLVGDTLGYWGKITGQNISPIENDVFYNVLATFTDSWSGNLQLGRYQSSYYLQGKLKKTTITFGDNFSRELIPCYRKSDNKPGFFDTMYMDFLTNQGSGEFGIGPDIN